MLFMKRRFTISKMVLVALLAIIPMTFYGQENKEEGKTKVKADRYWYIMGDFGAAYYHGDLARYGFMPDFEHTRINGHLGFGYQFGGVIGVNAKLGRGFAEGEKEKHGLLLEDLDYLEGNINAYFNLSNLISGYRSDRLFNFIPHIGVGQIQYKGETAFLQSGNRYAKFGYEEGNTNPNEDNGGINNRRVVLTVPVGAEFNFNIHPKWDVFADYTLNWVDSDILDNKTYGSQQVKNDMFSNINLGVRFKFNKSNNLKSMIDNFDDVIMVVTPEILEEKGDKVPVTIKITFPEKYFNKNAVMNFTPVLKYANGETQYCTVNFKGENVTGDGVVINYANGGTYTYTCEVAYTPDMENSELFIEPVVYAPKSGIHATKAAALENENCLTGDERKLADGVIATSNRIGNSDVNALAAPDNYEKETILTNTGDVYYQVNMANLNWNLPLNKDSENKAAVAGMSDNVKKGWTIKDVTIDGWASPEGEETFNEGLSERRAEAAAKYVKGELNKLAKAKDSKVAYAKADEITFNVKGNGPDWNGFMNAVEASNLKDKKSILNVIRSASADQREQEIRNMILIYPELEEEILPPLRRAVVNVNTFEPKHSEAELSELAISDPSSLSCEELLYAATLTEDLNAKATIYASAMKNYPECVNAFINAAQVQIELGNIKDAKTYLEKALKLNTKSAELYNNLGVIALIEKDYAKAESYFNQAKALGANVNYNTGILNITKGNYSAAVSQMTGTTCTYNLALAQVLNQNYNVAEETLNCAEQTAEVLYLKAIIGARTNDASKVFANLGKAIEKNADYKAIAAADREFIKLFNAPEFQALVK